MIFSKTYTIKTSDRISTLLESLRKKVKNFAVVDEGGDLVGKVKDLIVDANRQLSFVVSGTLTLGKESYFRLKSNLVQQIDSQNQRIVITKIDSSQIQEMSEPMEMEAQLIDDKESTDRITSDAAKETANDSTISSVVTEKIEPVEEEIIRLLGERLVVDRTKRKIGEVIVRKEIKTRMIQVPVRQETLIVEQVSPERKQLAEIDLGHDEISEMTLGEENVESASIDGGLRVSGEFSSPKIASLLLNAIAQERDHGCQKVLVTIVVENEEHQKIYQEWFSRTSKSKNTQQ